MPDATDTTTPAKVDPTEGHTPIPWTIGRHFPDAVYNADLSRGIAECCDERLPFDQVKAPEAGENRANAAFICRAVNNHDALIAELAKAHQIILNALNIMTPAQKHVWGGKNAADECDGDGITRFHERSAVLDAARGEA